MTENQITEDAPHVWIISIVLLGLHVTNALAALVMVLWRRNRQPLKVRSVTIHCVLIAGEFFAGVLLLLRIAVDRNKFPCVIYIAGCYIVMPFLVTPRVFRIWRVFTIFQLNSLKNRALMVQWRDRHGSTAIHADTGAGPGIVDSRQRIKRWSSSEVLADTDGKEITLDWDTIVREGGRNKGNEDEEDIKPSASVEQMSERSTYQSLFDGYESAFESDLDSGSSDGEDVQERKMSTQGLYGQRSRHKTVKNHFSSANVSNMMDRAFVMLTSRRRLVLLLKVSARTWTMMAIMLSQAVVGLLLLTIIELIYFDFNPWVGCSARLEHMVILASTIAGSGVVMIPLAVLCWRIRESYGLAIECVTSTFFLVAMTLMYGILIAVDQVVGDVETQIFSLSWILTAMILLDSLIIRWVPVINTFRHRYNTPVGAMVGEGETSLTTLHSILNSEIDSKYFYMYAQTEFSSENISFYYDVKFFQSIEDFDRREQIKRYIIATYFERGSPQELNIPYEARLFYIEEARRSRNKSTALLSPRNTAPSAHQCDNSGNDSFHYENMDFGITLSSGANATAAAADSGRHGRHKRSALTFWQADNFFDPAMRHVEHNMLDTLSRFQTSALYLSMMKQKSAFQKDLKQFALL